MAIATDAQVQAFVDQRIRPIAERTRALTIAITDCLAEIGDVYEAITQPSPTWKDGNTSNPPHFLTPNDIVNLNAFMTDINNAIKNHAQYPVMRNACVRPVE